MSGEAHPPPQPSLQCITCWRLGQPEAHHGHPWLFCEGVPGLHTGNDICDSDESELKGGRVHSGEMHSALKEVAQLGMGRGVWG